MKFKKYIFIFILSVLFFLGIFVVTLSFNSLFNFSSGELISLKKLEQIKSTISSEKNTSTYLTLNSFQGNSKFVALTYTDTRYNGKENTFNVFYDIENKSVIKSIKHKDIVLNITDALSIQYINNNHFVILDSAGYIYNVNLSNNNILNLGHIDISKKTYFKSIYSDNCLYILSRNYYSNFNEKLLDSNVLYKIDFNKKHTKASIETFDFDDKLLYSFVVNLKGDVGVVYSDCLYISADIVNKYKLISDNAYLSSLPSKNKHYKFIDFNSIKVKFINSEEEFNVDSSFIENNYINIHHELNDNEKFNVSSPKNIPFIFDDKLSFYFNESYENRAYDLPIYSTCSVLSEQDGKLSSSSITSKSELLLFNYKKYIAFLLTTDGLMGIDSSGSYTTLLKTKLAYASDNYILYLKDGALYYK